MRLQQSHSFGKLFLAFVLASRPKTLSAVIIPVLLGGVLALKTGGTRWWNIPLCLWAGLWIQIATNFANDYYDWLQGADTAKRVGPQRMTQAGLVTPRMMRYAFIGAFALAGVAAIWLSWTVTYWYLPLFVVSVVLGIGYTARPLALAYRGLGDFPAFFFFGPVAVVATFLAVNPNWDWGALYLGIGQGGFALALLNVNNLRDVQTDREAGKLTLPVRFGSWLGFSLFLFGLLCGWGAPLLLLMREKTVISGLLVTVGIGTIPAVTAVRHAVRGKEERSLFNRALALVAATQLIEGLGLLLWLVLCC
ncbi:MAG: 1,4-dihydroxy-2-naphthoate octaprenyltransferase [Lentisphaerae bacterium]|nr:MAG: 1,4-dihydroxy-2-naphthoate octaprenyltransferase [Lentisphaerota bacterium]